MRALVAILVLAGASAALGREYHVSVHGDDASDGSKTTPLKTIRNLSFENADGSPVRIDTDYCGKRRKAGSPFPGPFESPATGKQTLKVWPMPIH